ncbi:MAG: helix-turn-helix transcriptional regulator, partial [Gammaproteobacteria bacterium]|nr:helix-turn-helix transcriptional regulator [Gammaproteobacteria bacterium]
RRYLSDREIEVLRWVAKGHSNNQIAGVLNISVWTIQAHIKNIMHKLEVGKRSHAVAKAQSCGLITMV